MSGGGLIVARGGRHGDLDTVARALDRRPAGAFTVVVRDGRGSPVVIENDPFLFDGTPMPTRYWLVDRNLRSVVGTLESTGAIRRAEREVDPEALAEAHARYALDRDRHISPGHRGAVPSGGVGGTRRGVKCLHAHLAWWLAGGDDPVGRWTAERLSLARPASP